MTWRKKVGIYPWHYNQHFELLQSGEPFFTKLFQSIESAKHEIHFQVYIFENDATGKWIFEALLNAAKRGVKIYIWLDAYGSKGFPAKWQKQLELENAEVNYFSRFKFAFNFHMGLRLHHKIMLFDQSKALVGGINISDAYSHIGKTKTWLDFAIAIEGNVVQDLLRICLHIDKGFLPLITKQFKKQIYQNETLHLKARVLQNHWSRAKFGISRQYRKNIKKAQEEILLLASYFLPSPALKRQLKNAAKRGVKIKLIVGGISDVPIVKYASTYFYTDLLQAGVEIWEWQPSVLHAKLTFIDKEWMSIGSYNINHLSDFGSTECNIEIRDQNFQQECISKIKLILKKETIQLNAADYNRKSGFLKHFRNFISYHLVNFSFKILFYLQRGVKS